MRENTYIMIKPHFANYDSVIEFVKAIIEKMELKISEQGFIRYTVSDAQKHYAEHFRGSYENAKGWYKEVEDYIVSDKAYGMVVFGEDAIAKMRTAIKMIREQVPVMLKEEPRLTENVIHGSDSSESALKEIAIFNKLRGMNKSR